ncbi:PREDICTED: NADP-dependent oxidoreductase domain-containing protein 1 [Thamnophis sirtalis]|uniref:NADP-dependent oxidoreductase domain-containing protein 1 n=1 Tax=Thamnophis sirtalis TaxID=35019 RepID=A0A6I9YHA3_9SAUR|nr:PREDICTED: NADP-dependent oxidoreductase domain-containing protein 1 [Thamnophis sirtalis]
MSNIMANLKTFQPDYGIGTNEPLFHLRSCAKGLMVNACAHALFFCKLLNATKQKEENYGDVPAGSQAPKDNQRLNIGIIGGGHLGKQLAQTLLYLGAISGKNIQISTRRPETLLEFHKLGVECVYNNKQLVGWADVAFLCCLPCHIPHMLKQLICSSSILRPQYKCSENSFFCMWEANRTVLEALKDRAVIQETCPCNSKSEITVDIKWLAAVFYTALNSYTQQRLSYTRALVLLNQICFCEDNATTSSPFLVCEHFTNPAFASTLAAAEAAHFLVRIGLTEATYICREEGSIKMLFYPKYLMGLKGPIHNRLFSSSSFPWFDITTVQLKDSPLSQLLETNTSLQETIASCYFNMLTALAMKNKDLTTSMTKKTPLSAVLLKPTKSLIFQIDEISAKKTEEASSTDSEDL